MSSPIGSLSRKLALLLGLCVAMLASGCGIAGQGGLSSISSASPTNTASLSIGVLDGQVVARASCGAQNPVAACVPTPVAGALILVRTTTNADAATATTDAHGQFRVSLPPGHYLVRAHSGSAPGGATGPEITVTVGAGQTTIVQLIVSSGPPRS